MSDDLSLSGDEEPDEPLQPVHQDTSIAEWQVELLRNALDARGLAIMVDRQRVIASAAGRPVESLRALMYDEAMRVLTLLGQTPAPGRRNASTWDDREEDTWIDRL